jgi:hypothetical protein
VKETIRDDRYHSHIKAYPNLFNCFWICPNCGKGIVTIIEAKEQDVLSVNPTKLAPGLPFKDVRILNMYPEMPLSELPEYAPGNVRELFLQSEKSLRNKGFELSIMGMRAALEQAAVAFINRYPELRKEFQPKKKPEKKDLASKESGPPLIIDIDNLKQAIRKLGETKFLPVEMCDWANLIRLSGNEATHRGRTMTDKAKSEARNYSELESQNKSKSKTEKEKNPKSVSDAEIEATDIKNFTVMFLTYAFTLPAKVQKMKDIWDSKDTVPPRLARLQPSPVHHDFG